MKRMSLTILILLMVFAMACKESSDTPASKGSESDAGMTQSAPASSESLAVQPSPVMNPYETAVESATAPGMNPPHGQPNHRCDIAVGAPLSSPPGTVQALPNSPQQNIPAQTANTTTAPGMNPPHGQPNHRCDIAVGAPLNSPIVKPK